VTPNDKVLFGLGLETGVHQVSEILAHARVADEAGLDIVSLSDHPYFADRLDAYAALGFVLGATSNITVGLAPGSQLDLEVCHDRRLRLDYESHATGLDRNEVGPRLVAAGLGPAAEHALISLLALNGLRVSEATSANIEALG
jgi:hypothetical protein